MSDHCGHVVTTVWVLVAAFGGVLVGWWIGSGWRGSVEPMDSIADTGEPLREEIQ